MRKVANILLVVYVVICVFITGVPMLYFKDGVGAVIFIVLLTSGLFMYITIFLLSIVKPIDKLTIHKFAIILLAIYFIICVLFTLFGLVWNDTGESFKDSIILFVLLLIPVLSIYTIIYLLYDTYKQFALWKIVNIALLLLCLYIIWNKCL